MLGFRALSALVKFYGRLLHKVGLSQAKQYRDSAEGTVMMESRLGQCPTGHERVSYGKKSDLMVVPSLLGFHSAVVLLRLLWHLSMGSTLGRLWRHEG